MLDNVTAHRLTEALIETNRLLADIAESLNTMTAQVIAGHNK